MTGGFIRKDCPLTMKVWITITSVQTLADETETTRLHTQGQMERDKDAWLLTYRESAESGMAGAATCIRASADSVDIRRTGALNSRLLLEEGRRHVCRYDTGYGVLPLGVHTHRVENRLEEAGGHLRLRYSLEWEGGTAAQQELLLQVQRR